MESIVFNQRYNKDELESFKLSTREAYFAMRNFFIHYHSQVGQDALVPFLTTLTTQPSYIDKNNDFWRNWLLSIDHALRRDKSLHFQLKENWNQEEILNQRQLRLKLRDTEKNSSYLFQNINQTGLNVYSAYHATYDYFNNYYEENSCPNDLLPLISSMAVVKNGKSVDPAIWSDWLRGVEVTFSD